MWIIISILLGFVTIGLLISNSINNDKLSHFKYERLETHKSDNKIIIDNRYKVVSVQYQKGFMREQAIRNLGEELSNQGYKLIAFDDLFDIDMK